MTKGRSEPTLRCPVRAQGADHHGQSGRYGEYTLARHVADLTELLRALSGPPAVLVGRSYGANVAVSVVLTAPELVAAAVLVESRRSMPFWRRSPSEVQAALTERNRAFKAALSALNEHGPLSL
ncbi:MAG TPA: alpha/beta fold hydrolase [Burkholderiaceae bacterium]|nr:alpha/beta fold hydrolase [Burkholderiaceae bacterium]